jgi:ankyrin
MCSRHWPWVLIVLVIAAQLGGCGCRRARVSHRPKLPPEAPRLPDNVSTSVSNARESGDLSEFDQLLADPRNLKSADEHGATLLHMVADTSGLRVDRTAAERQHQQALKRAKAKQKPLPPQPTPTVSEEPCVQMAQKLLDQKASVSASDKEGNTPLHTAALRGSAAVARLLLSAGADPNATNGKGETPLHVLANQGNPELLQVLLEARANPNAQDGAGLTPLHDAASHNFAPFAGSLIAAGATVDARDTHGDTPLHCAARAMALDTMQLLLDKGAAVDGVNLQGRTPFHEALVDGRSEAAQLLLKRGASPKAVDKDGKRPIDLASGATDVRLLELLGGADKTLPRAQARLLEAANTGDAATVRFWLRKGGDPNAVFEGDGPPLMVTAYRGRDGAECIRTLVAAGAKVNARKTESERRPLYAALSAGHPQMALALIELGADLKATDADGDPPLHLAAEGGFVNVGQKLLDKGVPVDFRAPKGGDTPLHRAAHHGRTAFASLLLARGANVNAQNANADTPLHSATRNGHLRTMALLIQRGANVNAVNGHGNTPLDLAKYLEVVELLTKHGAKHAQR